MLFSPLILHAILACEAIDKCVEKIINSRSFQYIDDLIEGLLKMMNSDFVGPRTSY